MEAVYNPWIRPKDSESYRETDINASNSKLDAKAIETRKRIQEYQLKKEASEPWDALDPLTLERGSNYN